MPKLIKQAFFPCNPHTDVCTAMHYTATAITGAAQSGLGSSMLLGGERDKSALLTKPRSSSNIRPERDPPARCSKGTGPGVRSFQPWIPIKVPKAAWHCQGVADAQVSAEPGTGSLQIYSWHTAGWMGRGQLPASPSQKSILVQDTAASSAGWPGLPSGGTAQRRGLAVLRVK